MQPDNVILTTAGRKNPGQGFLYRYSMYKIRDWILRPLTGASE